MADDGALLGSPGDGQWLARRVDPFRLGGPSRLARRLRFSQARASLRAQHGGDQWDVITAIQERRTIGQFGSAPVSREVVARLVAAAIWAPTHRNTEPWRFAVVAGAARAEMADAVAAELAGNEGADGAARAARDKLLRAPAFIVVGQDRSEVGDDATRDLEDYAACSCATQTCSWRPRQRAWPRNGAPASSPPMQPRSASWGSRRRTRIVAYVYLGQSAMDSEPLAERRPAIVKWRGL